MLCPTLRRPFPLLRYAGPALCLLAFLLDQFSCCCSAPRYFPSSFSIMNFESMTTDDLTTWLERSGIPPEFCKKFADNYVDGTEFISLSQAEIREMVPPIGLAKKIMRLIPKPAMELLSVVESPTLASMRSSRHSLSPPFSPPFSPPMSSMLCEGSISSASSTPSRYDKVEIPEHWREETQDCIEEGVMDDSSRSDIVHTLVTLLVARHGPKPGRYRCEEVARGLILKYPFMKDDLGSGYASWVAKMMECMENRTKQSRKKMKRQADDSPNPKRKRTSSKDDLMRRYPVRVQEPVSDDSQSVAQHNKALHEEMLKGKPRDLVMLPLMKSTFQDRRIFVQNDAVAVAEVLEQYPALARPAMIEQEMDLIIGRKDVRAAFEKAWTTSYSNALLSYGDRSTKKAIKDRCSGLIASDDTSRQKTALAVLLASMKCIGGSCGTATDPLRYIYQEYDITETPESVCRESPPRNSPRIAAFVGEEAIQYFVLIEQKVLCQVPSFQFALYITFSAFYVFHLEYPKVVRNVFFFLQDYVLSYPDSLRRPATYLATASDINKLKSQ